MATTTDTEYSLRNKELGYLEVDIDSIIPNDLNPRRRFSEGPLAELADSIKAHGVLEPLLVRELAGERYEIIAGERRYRASQLAGLRTLPVRVLDVADETELLKVMLLENLQREDLDPIEEASGYAQLNRVCGLKQAQIAAAVHRSQGAIANRMRLLKLPEDVRELITAGELSPAHGVALARFDGFPAVQSALGKTAAERGAPVRELEKGVPFPHTLQEAGAIANLRSYPTYFDAAEHCDKCPHDAYRKMDDVFSSRYCLNVKCYRELQAAGEAAREASLAAKVAEAEAKSGAKLPALRELPTGTYERLDYYSSNQVPTCRPDCEKRSLATDYDGEAVEICRDPSCLRKLKAAKTRNHNKELRERQKQLKAQLSAAVDEAQFGPREMAIIAASCMGGLHAKVVREVFERHGIGDMVAGKDPTVYSFTEVKGFQQFADVPVHIMALILLEVVLLNEIEQQFSGGYSNPNPVWANWYLGADDSEASRE